MHDVITQKYQFQRFLTSNGVTVRIIWYSPTPTRVATALITITIKYKCCFSLHFILWVWVISVAGFGSNGLGSGLAQDPPSA